MLTTYRSLATPSVSEVTYPVAPTRDRNHSPPLSTDLYHTRVFPSNMFDQLKDDFDSTFIVLVLAGLVTASAVTRRLSQRRALQLAWK